MTETATHAAGWWGTCSLEEGQAGYWNMGGFHMWARRTAREWQVYTDRGDDPATDGCVVEVPSDRPAPTGWRLRRFAFRQSPAQARVLPALADRGVVIRPDVTFFVPPREECTLYISTPVWLTLSLGTPSPVMDTACYRPSDTWFGPNTRVGELCYASRTRAGQDLESVTRLPHRAISAVKIRNRAATRLEFERIMLPVMNLSLYADPSGYLWTEAVTLEREEDGDFADMRLSRGAPDEAGAAGAGGKAPLVSGPRLRHEKGLSLRLFGGLLK
jgi:hypothetical protein